MSSTAATTASRSSFGAVKGLVGQWCGETDPALFTGFEAAELVAEMAPVIRQLLAAQSGLSERVESCHTHDKRFASTAEWLARLNGSTFGDAKQALDTSRRLKACPATAEAFRAGDLSQGQAAAISTAAALDPAAEADLVAHGVRTHDLAGTRERAERVACAARHGEDPAARRARLRAKRRWSEFADGELAGVSGRFVREDLAAVTPVINAFADAAFNQARRDGVRDSAEAYRADGILAALAAAGSTIGITPTLTTTTTVAAPAESTDTAAEFAAAGIDVVLAVRPERVKWNMTVLVDGIALQRGYATARETCEIVGVGPVDIDWVRQILPDALVDVLVHDLVDIKAHTTLTRHRRKAIDVALQARDQRCIVPGCHRQRRLETDHRHDYAKGGPTSNANLGRFCDVHHDEKTHRGARMERTTTHWHWYPPPTAPGQPDPPPGSIPWTAPIGEHLTPFDLTDIPCAPRTDPDRDADIAPETGGTLPFGS